MSHLRNFTNHFFVMILWAVQGLKDSIWGHSYHCCPCHNLHLGEDKTMPNLELLPDIFGNQKLALNAL